MGIPIETPFEAVWLDLVAHEISKGGMDKKGDGLVDSFVGAHCGGVGGRTGTSNCK